MSKLDISSAMRLAVQQHQAGRLAEAEQIYRQVLAAEPNHANALHLLGAIAGQTGRPDTAIELIGRAIAIIPDAAIFHFNLGHVMRDTGSLDAAIDAYRESIRLNPDYAEAYSKLGLVLTRQGNFDEAICVLRRGVEMSPRSASALENLGNALAAKMRVSEAIECYARALELEPLDSGILSNMCYALERCGRLDEAVECGRKALALRPEYAEAQVNLGCALMRQGDLDGALAADRAAVALAPDDPRTHSNLLYTLHFHPDSTADSILAAHREWGAQVSKQYVDCMGSHGNDPDPDRRLRVGYLSPDFRDHPIGRFLLPLLAHHTKNQVEIYCYASQTSADSMTQRLASKANHWREIDRLSDQQAARLILDDKIDVLVDLTLHMEKNRIALFARKPAPVQVTYLAYCSTSGLPSMDYRLTDPYLDPLDGNRNLYTEESIHLPTCYWCYQAHPEAPAVSAVPAIHNGAITFGCLNNFCKVTAATSRAWSELLAAVPDSRLLVHANQGSHRQRFVDRFAAAGISRDRIGFVGYLPIDQYLAQYGRIDIALDPFPYAGGTTTCDALWMGVPVVSFAGWLAVSRSGLSLLCNAGLPELATTSIEQYVATAADLARDLSRLATLRSTLRERLRESPLMNAPRFASDVETAYRLMWRRWCASQVAAR
jgi:predicted O-linked N-acetylglucosamine transferase (SPINDLY family)